MTESAAPDSAPDAPWTGPFGLPDFAALRPESFPPAFERALAAHLAEVAAVRDDPAAPTFDNTVAALERSGRALRRAAGAFFTLAGACSDDAIREIERDIAPRLANHGSAVWMDARLAARVEAVDGEGLDGERARVLHLYRERFRRAGAALSPEDRARMAAIMERLSRLQTQFAQNVLADERDWVMELSPEDCADLPEDLVAAARAAGAERGREAPVVTLARASVETFLRECPRRDLRERAWRAWAARGANGGATDNRAILTEILALRAERARLLGFPSFAAYKTAPEMARTPDAVRELLMRVWGPAVAKARAETARLAALAAEAGEPAEIAPWDRRFWAARARARDHALDDSAIRAHLPLDRVIAAAMDVAGRLFGLAFEEVGGLGLHHPDARAWAVRRGERTLGLFVGDWFARPSKRSGAWMSQLVTQERFDPETGEVRPVVLNIANFAKGSANAPALLSWDDARTLFHEFGHALHGLMSDVRFPTVAGTSVARDFVELPSQLYEHWLEAEEVLAAHARHWRTGAPMPAELIEGLRVARNAEQGFATVEYLASALLDLELHVRGTPPEDPVAFEAAFLADLGMPADIVARHRLPHFLHVFSGDGYSAGYYAYMWAEVMDADAFAAFEEEGGPFSPAAADRLARHVLSVGGSVAPEAAWRAFRGRDPDPAALLRGRGLDAAA